MLQIFVFAFLNCQVLAFNNSNTPKEDSDWLEDGTYHCRGEFCKQFGYEKSTPPSKNFTIFINIFWSMVNQTFSDAYMKEIDARKMVLKYEPILVIMWRDQRFRAKGANPKDLKPLGANIIKELWMPDLYITPRLHSSMTNKNSQCKYV